MIKNIGGRSSPLLAVRPQETTPDKGPRLVCYVDAEGRAQASIDHPYAMIADFLRSEVQAQLSSVDYFMHKCSEVLEQKISEFSVTGNVFVLVVEQAKTSIIDENEYETNEVDIATDQFVAILAQWRAFLIEKSR